MRDYEDLTERQKLFIRKEYERKTVTETTLLRNAVFNAFYNANRKKGKPFRELWRKVVPMDPETVEKNFRIIEEIEKKETNWVEQIYRANGLKPPKG